MLSRGVASLTYSCMAKYLLVDGFNMAFRSYYALPDLTRSDGFPTGALHGWVKTLWKLEDMEAPDSLVVFFDKGGSDRHAELLPDYKANRDDTPEDLEKQFPIIEQLTHLMGYPVNSQEGVEADDLIGAAALKLSAQGHQVVVVSADKDLAQLVNAQISQLLPAPTANPRIGWRKLDQQGVVDKFGVGPEKIPDYLALVGDNSDNIPGIKGVGPKTAVKWITEFGDVAGIVANSGELKPVRFQPLVAESGEALVRNLKLVTLKTDFEVEATERRTVQNKELVELLESFEMKRAANDAWERYGLGL